MRRSMRMSNYIIPVSKRRATRVDRKKVNDVRRPAFGREAWIAAGREALIREGVAGVEIGKLARRLKITRGGFYWFFDSRQALLRQLLADWRRMNTEAFKAVLRDAGHNGVAEFRALVDVWVNEGRYDPKWDAAVRDWARTSPSVARTVQRVDSERIDIIKQIFVDMGCDETSALVRARITYFHQVGYYTLGVKAPREERLRLLPYYIAFLTGNETGAPP